MAAVLALIILTRLQVFGCTITVNVNNLCVYLEVTEIKQGDCLHILFHKIQICRYLNN